MSPRRSRSQGGGRRQGGGEGQGQEAALSEGAAEGDFDVPLVEGH